MWKQYLQPTKSTKAKSKEPDNVRERIQCLSQALSGLKEEIKIETSATAQNIERLEKQQFGALHSQVFALKKAFTDLADAMIDEVEGVRAEYRGEISEFRSEVQQKLEILDENSKNSSESFNKVSFSLSQSVKQAFQHLQGVKDQQEAISADFASLKEYVSQSMVQQNDFCTRIEHTLEGNMREISMIFKEQSEIRGKILEVEVMPKQLNYVIEKEKERVKLIEEKIGKELAEMDKRVKSMSKDVESVVKSSEIGDLKRFFSEIEYKSEESLREVKREFMKMMMESERKWEEFNREQGDFNDFIGREVKAIENVGVLVKRIEFLEEFTGTQRREIFNSITSLEQNMFKKHEKVAKAMHQLSRHLEIPEALLMI